MTPNDGLHSLRKSGHFSPDNTLWSMEAAEGIGAAPLRRDSTKHLAALPMRVASELVVACPPFMILVEYRSHGTESRS